MNYGKLYVVATPIGNLADITLRALDTLKSVDLIASEDTRHSKNLLDFYNIKQNLISLYDQNEKEKTDLLIKKLKNNINIALISDAGTPLINDPGYHLVKSCHSESIQVIPIPGPSALITALSVAGVATDRFCYEGFLPAKSKARMDKLSSLLTEERTIVIYESTHRLIDCLSDIQKIFGLERNITIAKELTKAWETIYTDKISHVINWLKEDEYRIKGEFVLILEGTKKTTTDDIPVLAIKALQILMEELPLRRAASIVAKIHDLQKNKLYDYAINHLKA